MGVFGVMVILALGYRYNAAVPHKNNILKRSSGWVSYVVLATDGIISTLFGFLGLLIFTLTGLLIVLLITFRFDWTALELTTFFQNLFALVHVEFFGLIFFGFVIFFAYLANEIRLRVNTFETDYERLKSLDGVLNIVIHAMETGAYLRVSLKSGKVYIGTVLGEQFESGDLDNITILPMESGYRDKDNLRLHLDCDYKDVYLKYGVVERTEAGLRYNPERAEDMMMVIRVSEIVSLSLFNGNMYKEFEYKPKPEKVIIK